MCIRGSRGGDPTLVVDGGGRLTRLICGSIRFAHSATHPLLSVLPRAISVKPAPDNAAWLEATLRLIEHELTTAQPGASTLVARLSDVLLVNAIRHWVVEHAFEEGAGWVRGLTDPRVARALGCVHRDPAQPWTVDTLARRSGMSRSGFAARFAELVGESPARYLTRWRMHLAAQALRECSDSMATIAESVGYSSEHAFAKAFKRTLGVTPGAFRVDPAALPS